MSHRVRSIERRRGPVRTRFRKIALDEKEVADFESVVEKLIDTRSGDFRSGFITESPDKLRRLPAYYAAQLGLRAFPENRCNAPWVSAVVEADGAVKPCFFHPAFGNIHERTFADILNGAEAVRFRKQLSIKQIRPAGSVSVPSIVARTESIIFLTSGFPGTEVETEAAYRRCRTSSRHSLAIILTSRSTLFRFSIRLKPALTHGMKSRFTLLPAVINTFPCDFSPGFMPRWRVRQLIHSRKVIALHSMWLAECTYVASWMARIYGLKYVASIQGLDALRKQSLP